MFCIPIILQEYGLFIHTWDDFPIADSFIIDQRSVKEKEAIRKNRLAFTFKKQNCDVWQDRPQLISFEKVEPKNWRPSIHYIEDHDLILNIILDSDPEYVAFVFFDAASYWLLYRIKVERDHFDCAMLAENLRPNL